MKIFLSVLLILPLITACASGPSKGQLDDEVRRLCAIDGGIKVYETVKLPAKNFETKGWGSSEISIPNKKYVKPTNKYYYESSTVYLVKGNPSLRKYHYKIFRQLDNKLIGESIGYSRVGGDIPGPWHHTSFRCPENKDSNYLKKQIFMKN